ncbi:MAG: family 16 glycoside hydrolase, partial [Ferruginibacter sp.]
FWLNNIKTFDGQIGSESWNKLIAGSKFNGKAFQDFAKLAKGKIALQQHPGSSEWRNIKVRLL